MPERRSFSPAQLAPILGVSESTLKRWVDSGQLRAEKTAGGHRKIAVADALAFMRAHGHPAPGAEALGLLAAATRPGTAAASPEELADLLLQGETRVARTVLLHEFTGGRDLADLLDRLVAPTMVRIGALWADGAIDVYQEHLATQRVWRILLELRTLLATPPAEAPLALGGAPEGDPYLLPTLMAELALREIGWRTLSLGPDVPIASLGAAVGQLRPRLVWVSLTSALVRPAFFQSYDAFYESCVRQGVAVAIGGQGITPALQDRLVASAFGSRLAHLRAFARGLG
jgi:MerR family transcriptional regulator, light-induced transcriptional regulator